MSGMQKMPGTKCRGLPITGVHLAGTLLSRMQRSPNFLGGAPSRLITQVGTPLIGETKQPRGLQSNLNCPMKMPLLPTLNNPKASFFSVPLEGSSRNRRSGFFSPFSFRVNIFSETLEVIWYSFPTDKGIPQAIHLLVVDSSWIFVLFYTRTKAGGEV